MILLWICIALLGLGCFCLLLMLINTRHSVKRLEIELRVYKSRLDAGAALWKDHYFRKDAR